jgi:hypothetical protein
VVALFTGLLGPLLADSGAPAQGQVPIIVTPELYGGTIIRQARPVGLRICPVLDVGSELSRGVASPCGDPDVQMGQGLQTGLALTP